MEVQIWVSWNGVSGSYIQDWDRFSSHDIMGHAIVPLHSMSKYLSETWVPLQSKAGEKVSGDILIRIREEMVLSSQMQSNPSSPILGAVDAPKRNSSASDM